MKYSELSQHYSMWTEDNERRTSRKGGWNEITDAYYGKLPADWPYNTRITDPRIRTTLIEKNARILNAKLRGTLVPREGADDVTAEINNSLLTFQWDGANSGGSMLTKLSISDMDTRLYGSKFALIKWKYMSEDDKVLFDGNEFEPLDIRDCGMDPSATHIRDAKWFQHRQWIPIEELEKQSDKGGGFKNLAKLKSALNDSGAKKSASRVEYTPRGKTIRGLEDYTGRDSAFPVAKIVTEYREDSWITFAPDYQLIIREIDNPYSHRKIPVSQLRYYHTQDDNLGESEVEAVLPLWRAIQATLCGYMDESILSMNAPLKVIENAARIETIQYGPKVQWLVDRQDAIEQLSVGGETLRYFETTYQALIVAFNTAVGDLSQGISNFGIFESGEKTATEIKATTKQQNNRDQKNQGDLGEFIKDFMLMWLSNNKQFLFTDPDKHEQVLRIIGSESFKAFKDSGLDEMELLPEVGTMLKDIITQRSQAGAPVSDAEIESMYDAAKTPKHPIITNPKEKDPSKLRMKPKLVLSDTGNTAELSVVPEDLEGVYDYIPDTKSMASGADQELANARQNAIALLTTNPTVLQLLAQDGYRPNVKELLRSTFEGMGLKDAERFFTQIQQGPAEGTGGTPGVEPDMQEPGVPEPPKAEAGGGVYNKMAGSLSGNQLTGVS